MFRLRTKWAVQRIMEKIAKHGYGRCKLTGHQGKFVASHLIPKALTRPQTKGSPFIEAGMGKRPVRRWDSWFDTRLVIQKGEDILSEIDNWAIRELRHNQLIWSGITAEEPLREHEIIPGTDWGVRLISGLDLQKLRLFFLSLLWRAAATERPEFSEVALPPDDLERLRLILLSRESFPAAFYPIQLTQLATVGVAHNQVPVRMTKRILATEGGPEKSVTFFRFYLEGLIAHIHCQASDNGETEELGPLVVGAADTLVISTVPFEASAQKANLVLLMNDSRRAWPRDIERLND